MGMSYLFCCITHELVILIKNHCKLYVLVLVSLLIVVMHMINIMKTFTQYNIIDLSLLIHSEIIISD